MSDRIQELRERIERPNAGVVPICQKGCPCAEVLLEVRRAALEALDAWEQAEAELTRLREQGCCHLATDHWRLTQENPDE